jgi:putative membrane protein
MNFFPINSMLFLAIPIIIQISLIIGVIIFIKKAIEKNNESADGSRSSRGAMRILDERFARGEIDEIEYLRKKDMLKRQ